MSDQSPRSPRDLRRAISKLPEDERIENPKVWYRSQKEHWLGWLRGYNSPGAYGRRVTSGRDARFAYNHVVNPEMLFYLVKTSGVDADLVAAAEQYAEAGPSMMAQSAWIRRQVPWEVVEAALWPGRRLDRGTGNLLRRGTT